MSLVPNLVASTICPIHFFFLIASSYSSSSPTAVRIQELHVVPISLKGF